MSYCIHPNCRFPENPDNPLFCQSCGAKILLKERYRPIQLLGEGGFSRTFIATDEQKPSQPKCVIKQLAIADRNSAFFDKIIELFHQEAQRLEELGEHPCIPNLLANFSEENQFYLVQELIVGSTLEDELKNEGCFDQAKIIELLKKLLSVLDFVHKHQVLHRDIKPGNIIRRSSDRELFLIDFGIAKIVSPEALVKTGTVVGTPDYVAPEQLKGKAVPSSDLYSLGITCIYLMTGISPFQLFDINDHRWVWQDYLPPERKVSDRLANFLNRLLQTPVKYRYESAEAALKALTYIQENLAPQGTRLAKLAAPANSQPKKGLKLEAVAIDLFKKHLLKIPTTTLRSSQGVDYSVLEHLLANRQWQKADEETQVAIVAAANKSLGKYLAIGDIAKIPLEDLEIIDRLWLQYSDNKFGFSVQSQIYAEVERDYPTFCAEVGWSVHNPQFIESMLNFSLQAPKGHLPSRRWVGGSQWWCHAEAMAERLLHK